MRWGLIVFVFFTLWSCNSETSQKEIKNVQIKENTPEQAVQVELRTPEILPDTNVFSLDYVMGKFDPAKHPDFTTINPPYSDTERYLRKDVLTAFLKMYEAAKKDGISLKVESATRNFAKQKRIWEKKWTGKTKIEGGKDATKAYPVAKTRALTILKWSSMPGTSRHHWGTDIDINAFENEYFEKGKGLKEYEWLTANAAKFGFCQVYTDKSDGRTGYNMEKWHWTYMPISKQLTQIAKSYLKNDMIKGFEGASVATEIDMVENYVLGIHQGCM